MTDPIDPGSQPGYPPPAPSGYSPPAPSGYSPGYSPGYPPPVHPPAGFGPPSPAAGFGPPPPSWPPGAGYPGQWPPAPEPPTSHTTRTVLISVAAAVVVAAAATGTYLAVSGDSSPRRVAVPASFDGYSQLGNATARRVESSIRALGSAAGGTPAKQIFDAASIGVYSHNTGDVPALIVLAMPNGSVPSGSHTDVARDLLAAAVPENVAVDPGTHGGSARCGQPTSATVAETMCAWSDPKTTGLVVSVNPALDLSRLAAVQNAFRDRVD
jgi:hypothetical protein